MVSIEYCDLEFGKSLGAGGSAMVYQGRWKSRNMAVAIKTSAQGIPNSEVSFVDWHVQLEISSPPPNL